MAKITENANYIVAMFNDLLSRFLKARKIKWPSFLQARDLHYWREKVSYRSQSVGKDWDSCEL